MSSLLYPSAAAALAAAKHTARASLSWDPKRHLLSRFSFGASPASLQDRTLSNPDSWWSAQVALGQRYPGYSGCPAALAVGPLMRQTAPQVYAAMKATGNPMGSAAQHQLGQVIIGMKLYSPAQLYESVVDFFANHLNIYMWLSEVTFNRHEFDRDVIRAHAFGKYSDMLVASSKSLAMLYYLNQSSSTKKSINQNYGRELLELHTVGMHYTENDMINSANILTGRTVDTTTWKYKYDPTMHVTGPIKVLGFSHPNTTAAGGEAAGDAYIQYLARHPLTAQNIARKLCTRYVSDNPSAALVSAVANVYLSSDTAILPTIKAILQSTEFWESRGQKTRKPGENMIASARALGAVPNAQIDPATADMRWQMYLASDDVFGWLAPNGYPDTYDQWRSANNLLRTWTFHRSLANSSWYGVRNFVPTQLFGTNLPKTAGAAVDALSQALVGQVLAANDRLALLAFAGDSDTTPYSSSRTRRVLNGLIALILDSPYHALR